MSRSSKAIDGYASFNSKAKKGTDILSYKWVWRTLANEFCLNKGVVKMSGSGQAESRLNSLFVQDAMYSSYTSILLMVVTHCCLHSRYQQAEIGRAGTSRHPALDRRLVARMR
jgi:hypothetical protein